MNDPLNTDLVDKAICFAVQAHHGTERRGKGFPYVIHPMEAVAIVATISNDPELLAAAALHDVVEDTSYTVEDIRKEFGDRIAELVAAETDAGSEGEIEKDIPWIEKKQIGIDRLKKASRDVKIVAMGDKLSNMRAIARDFWEKGDETWQLFHMKDPKVHAWRYRELAKAMSELEGTAAYREFNYLIEKVFETN